MLFRRYFMVNTPCQMLSPDNKKQNELFDLSLRHMNNYTKTLRFNQIIYLIIYKIFLYIILYKEKYHNYYIRLIIF